MEQKWTQIISPETAGSPGRVMFSRLDRLIEGLLITLLAFMPLAFGAVQAWSEQVVILVTGAMAGCLALRFFFRPDIRLVRTWAYVPVALLMLVVVVQLMVLPRGVVNVISPNTVALKSLFLDDLPGATKLLNSMTLSFYPWATRHDLRLLLAVAVVFAAVVNVYRNAAQVKRLLGAITIIGAVLAVLALVQHVFGTDRIYGVVATSRANAGFGTFANHSHYGQFMNLSVAAALALLLIKMQERSCRKRLAHRSRTNQPVYGSRTNQPVRRSLINQPARRSLINQPARRSPDDQFACKSPKNVVADRGWLWLLSAMIVFGAATVFVSLTRGGMLSLLVAGAFTVLALTLQKNTKGHVWLMAGLALGAFICVLYVGFDAVYDRLASLAGTESCRNRWSITHNLMASVGQFPLLGTGLGTHQVMYPMFERSLIVPVATHAENEAAQVLAETGVVGLGLLAAFGMIICRHYVVNIRRSKLPICSGAFGLGFGLLIVLINNLCDFGLHVPAVASLAAVFCGLLVSLSRISPAGSEPPKTLVRLAWTKLLGGCAIVIVAGIWMWTLAGANKARNAESCWGRVVHNQAWASRADPAVGAEVDFGSMLGDLSQAVRHDPDNIRHRYWLNVCLWQATRHDKDNPIKETQRRARQIIAGLDQARQLCPTFWATHCVIGQLQYFVLEEAAGERRIQNAFMLNPCDPTVCFTAGVLDAYADRFDASVAKMRRYVLLGGKIDDVVAFYVEELKRPELTLAVARGSISGLGRVTTLLSYHDEYRILAAEVQTQWLDLLENECNKPGASAWRLAQLAQLYRRQQDYPEAIEYYRRALAQDYGQVHWRCQLAATLADARQLDQAVHEANVCLRLAPTLAPARRLLDRLAVCPESEP